MIINIDGVVKLKEGLNWLNCLTTIFAALFGAGFGAWGAYWLNRKAEQENKKEFNLNYLKYSTSVLACLLNVFYSIKKDYIINEQYNDEFLYLEKFIEIGHAKIINNDPEPPSLNNFVFKNLASTLSVPKFEAKFDLEKLNFISQVNINVVSLLYTLVHSLEVLNQSFELLNKHLIINNSGAKQTSFEYFELWYSYRKNLAASIDDCIYFADLAIKSLNIVGLKLDKTYDEYKIKTLDWVKGLYPKDREKHTQLENWVNLSKFPF